LLWVGALALALWTIYLGWRLPRVYVAEHWKVAWVGLDVAQVVALLATAWAAQRRRAVLAVFASVSASLFLLDAWFDITTARSGDLQQSILTAAIIEVPAAIVLFTVAILTLRRTSVVRSSETDSAAPMSVWSIEIPPRAE
jgi:hypothetical protein